MARPVLAVVLSALTLGVATPAQSASPAARRLAHRYAVATSIALRELRPRFATVNSRLTRRSRELVRCRALVGLPRRRRGVTVAAYTVRIVKSLNPLLPGLQRFVDRLVFAGRGDRVLERGARDWLHTYRALARLPWVTPRLCGRVGLWRRHHFAAAYAPLTRRQAARVLRLVGESDAAREQAADRLAAYGVGRRLRDAFSGGLLAGPDRFGPSGASTPKPALGRHG